ncbi:MAG: hypothetical protein JWO05_519 [Gemmatimonadetes bacterium]|nr:hypothetical protein [Gemmatimonadota bacterium]
MARGARTLRLVVVALLLLGSAPAIARAQQSPSDRVRAQREELDRIRREREDLERKARELRSSVHDINDEITLLDRQASATSRIVTQLDAQLASISEEVSVATTNMTHAQDELKNKKLALQRRLVNIYKRGPLFTVQAMLAAPSFGELVARYKYLHLLALRDRALVTRVEALNEQVELERNRLVSLQTTLEDNRKDRELEVERLRLLQQQQEVSLSRTKKAAQQAEERATGLRKTENKLASALAGFEAERRRAETSRPNAPRTASAIKTSDYGRLDWPVDGPILYPFGRTVQANNTTIRWNGIGIRANQGTTVVSVAGGRVVSVSMLGTYGLTVIVDHGGGDYSIYGSLARADVRLSETVTKGQRLGTVGVSDPDLPAHLHFEIHHRASDGTAPAVDPASWLRDR